MKAELIQNLLKKSTVKTVTMNRITFSNKRFYVKDNPFTVYSGLTGALSVATFKGNIDNKRIDGWRNRMINQLGSIEKQESLLQSMADFGTLVHEAIVRIWENGFLDWEEETMRAEASFRISATQNNIEVNENTLNAQVFEYQKSIASLMMFLFENVLEIYAVESMAFCDDLKIATPIDLVVKLKDGRNVSLNIKTSSQIGEHQKEQVSLERYLWNKSNELKVDATGIIRPKDWNLKKGIPTYELVILDKETEKKLLDNAIKRLNLCLSIDADTYYNFNKESQVFTGKTILGDKPTITTKSFEQLYKEKFNL